MPSALIVAGSSAGALLAIITFWKVLFPFFKSIRDAWREFVTALHIFNGRDPYIDAVTGEKVEQVPPLGTALAEIRTTLKEQGESISDLTSVLGVVADQQVQINGILAEQHALRNDVNLLKSGTIERAAGKIENAALFDMIAKRDNEVIDPQDQP